VHARDWLDGEGYRLVKSDLQQEYDIVHRDTEGSEIQAQAPDEI